MSDKNISGAVLAAMVQFTLAAVAELRNLTHPDPKKRSYGIHARFSQFGAAFQAEFGMPLYTVRFDRHGKYDGITGPLAAMAESGAVAYRPVKGGYMIYNGKEKAAAAEAAGKAREEKAAAAAVDLAARIRAKAGAAARQQ